ncbi:hypothetical protein AAKU52_001462 [Pedobacter sp. CG_S7]
MRTNAGPPTDLIGTLFGKTEISSLSDPEQASMW